MNTQESLRVLFNQIIDRANEEKIFKNMNFVTQMKKYAIPKSIFENKFYWYIEQKEVFSVLNDINLTNINRIASELALKSLEVVLCNNESEIKYAKQEPTTISFASSYLDKTFSFDNYITGDFNKTAFNVLKNILDHPNEGKVIFLYSNTGLGKTHLVSAFANSFIEKYPDKKVQYIEATKFMKETVSMIHDSSKLEQYKDYFSDYDVFILEDIQFLSGKEKTNEIFFSIFNNLVANKKDIILTSDIFPEHLVGFPDRLISRFSSGWTVHIKWPEPNILKNIFLKQAAKNDLKITDDAVTTIVNYYYKDIRKLLGTINNLTMYAMMESEDFVIDKKVVKEVLNLNNVGFQGTRAEIHLNPNSIINAVANLYQIKASDIIGQSRRSNIVNARHMCVYLMKRRLCLPLQQIGAYLGHRNHATILSSEKKFNEMLKNDPELSNVLDNLIKKLC